MYQMKFRRGKYPVKTAPKSMADELRDYPNFSATGSVMGMKNLYYGLDAKLVRCDGYIYNVSLRPEIYDNL